MKHKSIEERCNYNTHRLAVRSWKHEVKDLDSKKKFARTVIEILTPNVTKSLPDGWQDISTLEHAQQWIEDRDAESHFVTIQLLSTNETVGFLFLYESDTGNTYYDLRFGYLLSEEVWCNGLGTELVEGLINWCQAEGDIKSISGGIDNDNIGSIKVLEKTGFSPSSMDNPTEEVIFYEHQFDVSKIK